MKFDLEIAVDQHTRARVFGSTLPNHLNMVKTMLSGALHVATSLMNTKLLSKWDTIGYEL